MKTNSISYKKMGRPTTYRKKYLDDIRDYLEAKAADGETPFVEEVSLMLGIPIRTMQEWKEKNDEFGEVYDELKTMQLFDIKRKALNGKYVSRIAALVLSADHGLIEKTRQEVTGAGGGSLSVEHSLNDEQSKKLAEGIAKVFEQVHAKPKEG